MDRDDQERQMPGARPLDRPPRYWGTYTPAPPYRVFRLIRGGASSLEPSASNNSDVSVGYRCLTIRLQMSSALRLVEKSKTVESNAQRPENTPKF